MTDRFAVIVHASVMVVALIAVTVLALEHVVGGDAALGVIGAAVGFGGSTAATRAAASRSPRAS